MSSADTIVKRALNVCGAHSEVNPADPELLEIGRELLVTLLGELLQDEVFIGREVTSITSVGLVATVTLAEHGFSTDDTAQVTGADQDEYNGEFAITVVNDDTFTYAITAAADTPATAVKNREIRVFVYPNELGDDVGDRRGAATDLFYTLALAFEGIGRTAIKPEHRARADAARPKLESRFSAPTIPNSIPSRLLPRGQGASRGVQASAFMSGEALDDDSAS